MASTRKVSFAENEVSRMNLYIAEPLQHADTSQSLGNQSLSDALRTSVTQLRRRSQLDPSIKPNTSFPRYSRQWLTFNTRWPDHFTQSETEEARGSSSANEDEEAALDGVDCREITENVMLTIQSNCFGPSYEELKYKRELSMRIHSVKSSKSILFNGGDEDFDAEALFEERAYDLQFSEPVHFTNGSFMSHATVLYPKVQRSCAEEPATMTFHAREKVGGEGDIRGRRFDRSVYISSDVREMINTCVGSDVWRFQKTIKVSYCDSNIGERLFSSFKRDTIVNLSKILHRLTPPIQLDEGWVEDLVLTPSPTAVMGSYCALEKFPKSGKFGERVTTWISPEEKIATRHTLCRHKVFSGYYRANYLVGPLRYRPTTRDDTHNTLPDLSAFDFHVNEQVLPGLPGTIDVSHPLRLRTLSLSRPDRSAPTEQRNAEASGMISNITSRSRFMTALVGKRSKSEDEMRKRRKQREYVELMHLSSGQ
ncbi:MAG: hypothetical protein TREMPRED_004477 [Tremellales sp. Tagirdzhanova-0007]|nr:MAG: hypothetical protein TREMPRED_004477 [Tremellales sp. Tagirdzhanova-0007]